MQTEITAITSAEIRDGAGGGAGTKIEQPEKAVLLLYRAGALQEVPLALAAADYKWAFEELIDSHYGAARHHIGDGDGLTKGDADRMRKLLA
jgi:hypothetical protein